MKGKIANRYLILEIVGRGGMGAVYKARDELLERIVAIKGLEGAAESFVTDTAGKNTTSIFMNEARMMARVHHPNIMPIYDLVQEDGALYIVMPLMISKFSLMEANAHQRPLIETIRMLERVADGLDFLHKHQVLHRDLKPANIFIGEDDQPYIADLGIAQDINIAALEEEISGTIAYMPPELLMGEKATIYGDIYSFGLLAYNALTSTHPFSTDHISTLIHDILHSSVPSIREHRPELSEAFARDIDAVIAKLTAKKPDDRYPSARQAVDDLYRIVYSGQQVIDGKLFISYARKDQDFVYALADELQRYNVDLWIDRHIEYGTEWDQSIDTQLNECDVMLVVTTPASMQSPYVTYEWSYFKGANKPVFPFVPQSVVDQVEIHPRLQRMQYIKGADEMGQNVRHIIEVMSQVMARRKKQQQS